MKHANILWNGFKWKQKRSVELIRSEVAKEFGEERLKDIEYFGHYECGDMNMIAPAGGLADCDGGYEVHSSLFDMFLELGIDVPRPMVRAL